MGTRGAVGFRLNGEDYINYNHYDSYPEHSGCYVLQQLRYWMGSPVEQLAAAPTVVWIDRLKERVAAMKPLARLEWAGDRLDACLAHGVYAPAADFLRDSLFCEWAYIVNLDAKTLDVYTGFCRRKHTKGRYSSWEPAVRTGSMTQPCYAVALIQEFDFDALPEEGVFITEVRRAADEHATWDRERERRAAKANTTHRRARQ